MDDMINRSAIVVTPRKPYLEWAKQDDAEGLAEMVFETMHREPHIYLLPEYGDSDTQIEVLEEFWPDLFEAMLEGWVTDESMWPENRSWTMFNEWFEVKMTSMVIDLVGDGSINYE